MSKLTLILGAFFLSLTLACSGGGSSSEKQNSVTPTGTTPSITTQPLGQSVIEGQTATFSVVATGSTPLSYVWKKNNAVMTGATASSYTTSAATIADDGATFTVTVSNSAGSATSNAATLTVTAAAAPPTITTQPQNQSVTAGQTATFSVAATGSAPLSYVWRKNNAVIPGATTISYTTSATTIADNGATFTVVVSNGAGDVTSDAATLTVTTSAVAPTITTQPQNRSVTAGQTATFSVVATGSAPLSYVWRKNNAVITGATTSSYTTPATTTADNGASFTVTVSNSAGNVTSNAATLTVTASAVAPTISSFSANPSSITQGQSASLNWSVTGASTLSINQGVGTVTGTTVSVSPAATLTYTLTATNATGSDTAQTTVTVAATPISTNGSRYPAGRVQSPITPAVRARLQTLFTQGGLKANVFLKAGDSITAGPGSYFMEQFDLPVWDPATMHDWDYAYNLGSYQSLETVRAHFLAGRIGSESPYVRASLAARAGMGSDWALGGSPSPLDQEMQAAQGAFCVIMFGTNDLTIPHPDYFAYRWMFPSFMAILDRCTAANVIPILTSPPPKSESADALKRTRMFSRLARAMAQARQIPFIDYYQTMLPLPDYGLGGDGVHPNAMAYDRASWLTTEGLQYGYNMRNLVTLQSLDRVYQLLVVGGSAPDAETGGLQGSGTIGDPYLIDANDFSDFRKPAAGISEMRYQLITGGTDTWQLAVASEMNANYEEAYGIEILDAQGNSVAKADEGVLTPTLNAGTYTIRVYCSIAAKEYALAILASGCP